ncbi:Eco57I restriction-modification methylase domain-containing protein, partial [uncultured Planktosalinus sp.]|uniref:Eco57I restriction-modification methylase domain-containing protein n=1 Tax=uncultured Planktosalinus sp. TaxID=1810935 RepID=UPI0030DB95E9
MAIATHHLRPGLREFLIAEHAYVDELHAKLFGDALMLSEVENSILENNLYGVDINNESVEIAKLSLWLRTAQKGRKLTGLNNNIKCGNSLIDDPAVAGDKAFDWEQEFPEVFAQGGFDVVIGNPPYVRAELLGEFIEYLSGNYKVFNSASDLFAYFYELGTKIIKPTFGILSFISNTFDKTTAGKVLREYLSSNTSFYNYIDFTEVQVFDGATTYPVIISFTNNQPKNNLFNYIKIPKSKQGKVIEVEIEPVVKVDQSSLNSDSWSFMSKDKNLINEKITKLPTVREIYGKCYRGLITGLNDAFIVNKEWSISEHIKYIYEGKEIKKWQTPEPEQKLILFESKWTNEKYGNDISEDELLSKLKQDYPEIMNHLLPF